MNIKLSGMYIAVIFMAPLALNPSTLRASEWVASVEPVAMILRELVSDGVSIKVLLPPGVSPHTFEPTPGQIKGLNQAPVVFSVGKNLDGWVSRFTGPKRIELMSFLPQSERLHFEDEGGVEIGPASLHSGHDHAGHDHHAGEVDPHFWLDPVRVIKILPALTQALCEVPGVVAPQCAGIKKRAQEFSLKLQKLDQEIKKSLLPLVGRGVILFHPSFAYYLNRYGLKLVASIEPSPGKEPTPKYLARLIKLIKANNIPAVFSEPQLPNQLAALLAKEAKVNLGELDPNGGVKGRKDYFELLNFNTAQLVKAFQ